MMKILKFKSRIISCVIFALVTFTFCTNTHSTPSVWDVLRSQLSLDHAVNQPAVQNQIRWIASHPSYIQKLARQSEPYIYHIVTEIKKRRMPGEIALIPMIESSYDPFAYSGVGAAGLWQLMPGTGTDLGLKQDWWFDGRRSIRPSTDAALSYLSYLHSFFNNDWILAFAAYDAGEGAIARIIKNSGYSGHKINFWALSVPQETSAYIPRLLALAEVIQNPGRYKVVLPDIPHLPYFREVNIGSQIDLNHAAKLAGISYKDLIRLNPGFNHWATAPYLPYKLLIPANKAADFSRNLANVPINERVSWTRHKVSAGDNLVLIAQKYHTTVNLIKELNQLKSSSVQDGQYVLIPSSRNTAVPVKEISSTPIQPQHFTHARRYKVIHIVQKNESYANLQSRYGASTAEIQFWNQLSSQTPLNEGQQLIIWKRMPSSPRMYIVKASDSLNSIAKQNNTTLLALLRLNPSLKVNQLRSGQALRVG